jgi:hypothetical protein
MEPSSVYDTFLVRFKKDLWNKCVEYKVFDYIGQEHLENTKKVFENIVSNYQTQILQHEGQENTSVLYDKLINEISLELTPLKKITRDSIQKDKQELFDKQLVEKQNEFNTMMKKDVPPSPQFKDENKDDPIDQKNLDELIEKQMKEREKVMNINEQITEPQNTIIEQNPIIETREYNLPEHSPMESPRIYNEQLQKIEQRIQVQTMILQQILESQLTILKKLK